jgi:hypothetical protein
MSLSPKYGLRAPDLDDPVDPVLDLANLRDDVEATLIAQGVTDTGWVTLAWGDARLSTYTAGAEPRYRVKNGVCTIVGQATTTTAGLIDSGVTMLNIPAIARPLYRVPSVQQASGDDRWALIVNANGAVSAERYGPSTQGANVWLPFAVTYLVG